ncbi:MAG: hypothetical protein ACKVOR_08235 [Flavobacteriales bacterium]
MMKETCCLHLIFLLTAASCMGQRGRQMEPIFTQGTAYRNTGWFISLGITYMLPEYFRRNETGYLPGNESADTLYTGLYKRNGRIGIYAEAGRHHFFEDSYLLDHIDYGIHFKKLTGRERFDGHTRSGEVLVPVQSSGIFKESFVGAFCNASNIIQVKPKLWIQNSIGANVDLRVISNRSISNDSYGAQMHYAGPFMAQLHYKIGFGWKPEPGIYIMPMLETPLLTAYPWDGGKSTMQYFSGRYRPLILTLRIQWLSEHKGRSCDAKPGTVDHTTLDKENPGKHKHDGLWGPESKQMKRAKKKQDDNKGLFRSRKKDKD